MLAGKSFYFIFLISKVLIDLYLSHDEFVLVNDTLRECDDMKEETKNLNTLCVLQT